MLPPLFRSRTLEIQKGIAEAQAMKRTPRNGPPQMEARMTRLADEIEKFRAESQAEMEQEGERIAEETSRQMAKLQQQVEWKSKPPGRSLNGS